MTDNINTDKPPKEEPSISRNRRIVRRSKTVERHIAMLNILMISAILLIGFLYLLFFKRDSYSPEENRPLAKLPKFSVGGILNGNYTEGISDYYDDAIPNRSEFKKYISRNILPYKGLKYGDSGIIFYGDGKIVVDGEDDFPLPIIKQTTAATVTAQALTTTVTTLPSKENPEAEGMVSNNILVVKNRGIMLYGGGKKNGQLYAKYLNAYKADLGEDVNVYSMVCPTPVSYYLPKNYSDLTANEEDVINHINKFFSGVTPVDAFTALLKHKNEPIFSRTDHHWQGLGAYYAAEEFAKVAGVEFAELNSENFETVTLPNYCGTLYGYTKNADLLNNPEDFVYYIPKAETVTTRYSSSFTNPRSDNLTYNPKGMSTSGYYMVFGGDDMISHIKTSAKNGRNLVIFKDSYGNALVPPLVGSFENIYLCDVRYFNLNAIQFIKGVGATDVLFAMNTFSATGVNFKHIETNRTQGGTVEWECHYE